MEKQPALRVAEASDAERDEVLAHTHAIWGGKRSPEAYREKQAELLRSPWGRRHYRFNVGKDDHGRIVTACKTYELDMWIHDRPRPTLGFGAVFTLPDARRQGHAARLLAALMADYARRGFVLATLFSDIDPAYYEKLGFVRLPSQEAECPVSALESYLAQAGTQHALPGQGNPGEPRLRPADLPDEYAILAEMSRTLAARHALSYYRSADQLPYLVSWHGLEDIYLVEHGGKPIGFLIGRRFGTYFGIADGGTPDPERMPLWLAALAGHATAIGATEVGGRIAPVHPALARVFTWTDPPRGTWMAAPLGPLAPDLPDLIAASAHCQSLDHF